MLLWWNYHVLLDELYVPLNASVYICIQDSVTSRWQLCLIRHCYTLGLFLMTIECLRKRKYLGYIRDFGNILTEIRQFDAEIWNLKGVNLRTLGFLPDISVCANTPTIRKNEIKQIHWNQTKSSCKSVKYEKCVLYPRTLNPLPKNVPGRIKKLWGKLLWDVLEYSRRISTRQYRRCWEDILLSDVSGLIDVK